MSGPTRLRDDPDFSWETGCDLEQEPLALESHDMTKLRRRILAGSTAGLALSGVASAGVLGGQIKMLVVGLFAGGAIATGLLVPWGTKSPTEPTPVEAPATPIAAPVDATPIDPSAEIPPPLVEEPASTAPTARPVSPSETADEGPASSAKESAPAASSLEAASHAWGREGGLPDVGEEPEAYDVPLDAPSPTSSSIVAMVIDPTDLPPSPPDPTGPSSEIGAELALYDAGRDQLAAGQLALATTTFQAYLVAYPMGHLRAEAQLGLLEALVRQEAWNGVVTLTVELLEDIELGDKQAEIQRVRADALLSLGRCDEAQPLLKLVYPPADQARLKRQCRRGDLE